MPLRSQPEGQEHEYRLGLRFFLLQNAGGFLLAQGWAMMMPDGSRGGGHEPAPARAALGARGAICLIALRTVVLQMAQKSCVTGSSPASRVSSWSQPSGCSVVRPHRSHE